MLLDGTAPMLETVDVSCGIASPDISDGRFLQIPGAGDELMKIEPVFLEQVQNAYPDQIRDLLLIVGEMDDLSRFPDPPANDLGHQMLRRFQAVADGMDLLILIQDVHDPPCRGLQFMPGL